MSIRFRINSSLTLAATLAVVCLPLASQTNGQGFGLGSGMGLNFGSGSGGFGGSGFSRNSGVRTLGAEVLGSLSRGGSTAAPQRWSGATGSGNSWTTTPGISVPAGPGRSTVSPQGLARIVQAATGISIGSGAQRINPGQANPSCILNPAPVQPVQPVDHVVLVQKPAAPEPMTEQEQARMHVLTARVAFKEADYAKALRQINAALALLPKNKDARQFKSLILFAAKDYKAAAAEAYDAVLLGPIWTWDTIRDLYQNADLYTEHYRQLEQAAKASPDSMGTQFLLAYHHLALDHLDHGEKQLRRVLEIQPEEPVTTKLLEVVVAMKEKK